MQTRERRSLVPLPTLPDLGRTGRKGAPHVGLPEPSPLPSLTSALSRRAALFGAVTVAGVNAAALPANAEADALSANDARLVALAAELRATSDRLDILSASHDTAEDLPEWDALIERFTPLEVEVAETPADTLAGVLAKARASQVPPVANCVNGIADSIAVDLVRLFGGPHA